jgi:hypothetical protein
LPISFFCFWYYFFWKNKVSERLVHAEHQLTVMEKMSITNTTSLQVNNGRPTIPLAGRQPMIERKISDPSSACPRGERYPIPVSFEDRIKLPAFERV